jgi:hypothetical protein
MPTSGEFCKYFAKLKASIQLGIASNLSLYVIENILNEKSNFVIGLLTPPMFCRSTSSSGKYYL